MSKGIFDALVIGSGPSGAFAVKELTAQGLKTLLVEAGPEIGTSNFKPVKKQRYSDINLWERAKATLFGQSVQARAAFFNPTLKHLFINDRRNPYSTPPDLPYLWIRARQGGGRAHTFGRMLLRWTDDDFQIHSRTGRGVDWPVSYKDLVPYYEEVERTLNLHGTHDGVPTLPDGIYSQDSKLTPAEAAFKSEVERKWADRKVVPWRYILPDPTRVMRPLQEAIASGNLETRYNSIVRRVIVDEKTGRASGVETVDGNTGEVHVIRAASVVLCASPIESVRILLNSANDRHPNGLANRSGTLGKYFMDQLPCIAVGTFPKVKGWATTHDGPVDPFYRPPGGIFIPRFIGPDGVSAASDFDFQGGIGRAPVGENEDSKLLFFGFGLTLPDSANRITLNPRRRDAWGIPIPHIRYKISDIDRSTLRRQVDTLAEIIKGAGGELNFTGSPLGLVESGKGAYPESDPISRFFFRRMFNRSMIMGAAIHECGGARMGHASDSSVLNGFNQTWEVPNLFVTDASSFPGSGVTGTTLTIMALTVRACRHLAGELRNGRL